MAHLLCTPGLLLRSVQYSHKNKVFLVFLYDIKSGKKAHKVLVEKYLLQETNKMIAIITHLVGDKYKQLFLQYVPHLHTVLLCQKQGEFIVKLVNFYFIKPCILWISAQNMKLVHNFSMMKIQMHSKNLDSTSKY